MRSICNYITKLVYFSVVVALVHLLFTSSASAHSQYSAAYAAVPSVNCRGMSIRACEAAQAQAQAQERAQAAAAQAAQARAAQAAAEQRQADADRAAQARAQAQAQERAQAPAAQAAQARAAQAAAEQRQADADRAAQAAAARTATISPTLIRYNSPITTAAPAATAPAATSAKGPQTTVPAAGGVFNSQTSTANTASAFTDAVPVTTSYGSIGGFAAAQPQTLGADNYLKYCDKYIKGNGSIEACSLADVKNHKEALENLKKLATDTAAAILKGEAVSVDIVGRTDKRCGELSYSGLIECQSGNALERARRSATHLSDLVRQVLNNSHDPSRASIQIVLRLDQKNCPPPSNDVICIVTTQIQDTGNLRDSTATFTTRAVPRPVSGDDDLCLDDPGIQLTFPCPAPGDPDLCLDAPGIQLTFPCPVPPPSDRCPDDPGIQLTLPCPAPGDPDRCLDAPGIQLTLPCPVPPPPVTTFRRIKPS